MLTRRSRIRDVYAHPIGHDIVHKLLLQLGRGEWIVTNPFVSHLRLDSLPGLTRGFVDESFLATLLELLNSERDVPAEHTGPEIRAWWKEAVFYQIYPRSFMDSNGDGIGDLRGIASRLDYIKSLGTDAIWLCPVYDSPDDDNGYDVRNYREIMAKFGTMADFDNLLQAIHDRGMRLIMDLVVNHTSDEHEWYRKTVSDPTSKYGNYYIFRDKPNNWTSFFSGSAWVRVPERNQWVLHLFSKKQIDLNWDNPDVRADVHDIVHWWLAKGVDGFRMDVVNYISKREGLPDGNDRVGELMGYRGIEHYFYGPNLHRYLAELKAEAFRPSGAFTVGETAGIGLQGYRLLTGEECGELDMSFNFDHLETPGHVRYEDYRYDLEYYKRYAIEWAEGLGTNCRAALFFENHDNPCMISKVDPDPEARDALAKLIATMLLTLCGTPFIYQGQELGMVNRDFSSIDEIDDVESRNLYEEIRGKLGDSAAFVRVLAGSRDHARTPMQWTSGENAGFTTGTPWLSPGNDRLACNAADQEADGNSVLNHYRRLIVLRKGSDALVYGTFRPVRPGERDLFAYLRSGSDGTYYVECNLGRRNKIRHEPPAGAKLAASNYPGIPGRRYRPYEANVWKVKAGTGEK